jgi:uncharacterized membrane protein YphA (DoxX/SURF4 family)
METDMNEESHGNRDVGVWVSVILRLAIAALFFAAAVGKWKGGWQGIEGVVGYFQQTFAATWLPRGMVTLHGYVTSFMEPLLVLWLVLGYRLKTGWIVAGLFMTTLAFGMSVAGKHDVAAHNFTYVLICCAGLYFSQYDRFSLDTPPARRP